MIDDAKAVFDRGEKMQLTYTVRNTHRAVGTRLSSEITRTFGMSELSDDHVKVRLRGSAGQSLGAFLCKGITLEVFGDANDYVGKGLSGGHIVVRPTVSSPLDGRENTIIGNTVLYGATAGKLYAAGRAGERFAVRNSGAVAIVEGCGDHGCEYMTGGVVAVLGRTGVNFGAGLTGGFAYVLDLDRDFVDRYNHELIDIHRITPESMEAHLHHLRGLIEAHARETGSVWGREILDDFRSFLPKFWLVKAKAADLESLIDSLRQAA
jgi:glutamate synthase (NADPH/NADH) large chain